MKRWVGLVGGNPQEYGTHSLRRTKATLIYRRTKNLRAVHLLLALLLGNFVLVPLLTWGLVLLLPYPSG